jgi:tellurite resistance protein TehA-like permease
LRALAAEPGALSGVGITLAYFHSYRWPLAPIPEIRMSMSKTALLSILVACWIVGLLNQFHDWSTTLSYLVLSLLLVAVVAARRHYQLAYAKNRTSRRR